MHVNSLTAIDKLELTEEDRYSSNGDKVSHGLPLPLALLMHDSSLEPPLAHTQFVARAYDLDSTCHHGNVALCYFSSTSPHT